jgi:hypothetical protein
VSSAIAALGHGRSVSGGGEERGFSSMMHAGFFLSCKRVSLEGRGGVVHAMGVVLLLGRRSGGMGFTG